jgi:hypothetical protein
LFFIFCGAVQTRLLKWDAKCYFFAHSMIPGLSHNSAEENRDYQFGNIWDRNLPCSYVNLHAT